MPFLIVCMYNAAKVAQANGIKTINSPAFYLSSAQNWAQQYISSANDKVAIK